MPSISLRRKKPNSIPKATTAPTASTTSSSTTFEHRDSTSSVIGDKNSSDGTVTTSSSTTAHDTACSVPATPSVEQANSSLDGDEQSTQASLHKAYSTGEVDNDTANNNGPRHFDSSPRLSGGSKFQMFGHQNQKHALRKSNSSSHLAAEITNEQKKQKKKNRRKPSKNESIKSTGSGSVASLFSRLRHTNDTEAIANSTDDELSEAKQSSSFELLNREKTSEDTEPEDGAAKPTTTPNLDLPKIELEEEDSLPSPSKVTFEKPRYELEPSATNSSELLEPTTAAVAGRGKHSHQVSTSSTSSMEHKQTSNSDTSMSSTTFKLPLTKLKRKTVSMLFSDATPGAFDLNERMFFTRRHSECEPRNSVSTDKSIGEGSIAPRSPEKGLWSKTPSKATSRRGSRASSRPESRNGSRSGSPTRPPLLRSLSTQSQQKKAQSPSAPSSPQLTNEESHQATVSRPRSKTLNSLNEKKSDSTPATPPSFVTRPSFTSLFGGKLRSDDGTASRRHSPSPRPSVSAAPKEMFSTAPEPLLNESVDQYLARLKELGVGSSTAAVLSKADGQFYQDALREYINGFDFADEPIDMSLRKFIMYCKLPNETQQIDRVLESFSQTYHASNPNIYLTAENAYIVAFSLMILHTDFFNKNNKHKMQKSDYLRNTYAKGVAKDALECFYDNITYTPFIHTDEDFAAPNRLPWARRSSTFRNSKDMLDPYTLLLDCRLDVARPSLGAVLSLEDPYDYCRLESIEAFKQLRQQFINGPYLQLVSQRSRPEAFLSPDTTADPEHSDPGIVDIKVVKIGILYRREARRMIYSKSTWKEWGAILTASQLYLFKDVSWIKGSVLSQQEQGMTSDVSLNVLNQSAGIIRAPIDGFHPSAVLSTVDMMALTSSKEEMNQKCSFLLIGRGNTQDWFAASDDADMQDWMTKINFASSFNTYHIGLQEPNSLPRPPKSSAASMVSTNELDPSAEEEQHALRVQLVEQKLSELNARCGEKDELIEDHIRNGHHLKILSPLLQRSREAIIFAAGRLAAKLDWHFMDAKRLQCYRYLFGLEKEVETELCGNCKAVQPCSESIKSDVKSEKQSITSASATKSIAESVNDKVIVTSPDNGSLDGDVRVNTRLRLGNGSATSLKTPSSNESLTYFDSSDAPAPPPATSAVTGNIATAPAPVVKKNFHASLRDKSLKIRRDGKEDEKKKNDDDDEMHRSPSLMRKEEGDFTLHGKKFSVVEVNPEFAAPTHKRTPSFSRQHGDLKEVEEKRQSLGLSLEPSVSSTSYGTADSELSQE